MALTPFDGELDSPAGLQSFTGKLDGESKDQDSALVRGTKNAWNSIKTGGALLTGDADLASQLAAERDSYRRANPGTKEGNELMKAWESGDGISGGISNVAGEISKDWREAPGVMAGIRETGKNLSAMGGGIVEQIPNMVAPMGGMLAGGAAGSMAGPIGTVGGAWAGATAGNTLVESGEQVDRALMAAGINPQDKAAVRDFLAKNGDTVLGQAGTKGAIIGAVDTATLGLGGALLRAPAKAAIERAVASGINPADNLAIKAAVNADPVYLASQKGVSALGRNATVAGLEPAGEFAGEYLGQGVATGDWDTKGAALEALSSLGQSGITFAGQKIYDAATSPLRKSAPKEQAPAAITPEDTAQMNALNADLGGAQFNYENIIPSEQKLLPPGVITVPNNAGGETVIDASAGPIQGAAVAAVTNSTIAEDIASGIPLKGYAPDQAKAELASRPDAERYEIRPHPVSGDRGRVAIVPKSAQALAEIDAKASAGNEAMARSEQLAAEEGARKQQAQVAKDIQAAQKQVIDLHRSAASIEKSITPSTPPQDAAIAREQAAELRSQAAAIQTQIQTARAAATQQATQGVRQRAEQNAPATEQALAQDAAQQELAPAVAQPLSETPANQAIAKQRTQHATQQAGVRAQQLAQEEVGDQPAPTVKVPRPMKVGGLRAARYSDEQLQSVVDNDSVPATSRRAAAAEIAWRQAEAEAAAQAEIAKSTGKASTRRAGESESDWLYRKAAEKNKAKAEQQRPSEPVSEVDAKDLEVVGRAVTPTGDLGLSIIREDAMPDMDKAGPKEVSKQSATFLRHVAKLFGKEIVFVGGMNEDGFYQSGNKIYLSTKSNINQLRVLGHEMLHALKRQNRASYDKLLEAVGAIATDAQLKAQFKDYFALDAEMNQKTGAEIDAWLAEPKNREMILEEMMADLSGNRWAESSFWESVFTKIDAKYGSEQAKGIIAKLRLALVAALNKLMSLVKGGQFSVDARVSEHLESIREALATGFADYAKAVKDKQVSEGGVGEVKFSGKQTNIENLKKLMTDREKSKVGKRNAERIVELFNVMPSEKEMAAVAYAGKAKRGWYKNSANALTHLFGSEARRFAGLLAALSPQVSVEVNTRNALRMWANWDASGRPTDKPSIMRLLGQSVEGSGTEASVMGAWVNNSMDALTIQNLDNLTLSGPKVNSFMLNLVGNWEEVTNDAWVANYALVDQNLFSGTGKSKDGSDPGKGAGYLAMNVKTRMAAKILSKETGVTWAPAEVQETIWSWAKTMLETLDASGETRTAKQLMDDGVITDDLIAATPDFELLFRQEPYAGILRNAGMGSKLNSMPMPKHEDPGRAPFADEKRQSLLDEAARRIEFLQRQRRTNMQISWEAKPGRSTGILPNIFNAPLHIQQQYLADIFAEFDMLQVGKKLGIDMRRTLFGPSAWKGDVAAGAQTILQKIGIVADNMGSVKVDADSRKNLEVAASILGYVLNQEGVYWHYPIYRAPDNHAMYPTGVEVNFGRSLTTAEVAEFYGIVSRLAKHQDWAPANTPTGVRFLNFTSFNDNPAQQFDHAQFRAIIKRASGRLKSWADGAQLRDFTFDGDAIENNWKENPNGEDYRSRVGKAGRSDLLKWADDQLSPAIDRVNKRYADQYGWGPASRLERDAAATGATPDNFSARFSPARSDAAGNERAGGRDAAATGKLASYGQPSPGAVSVQGFHYSGTERKQLDGRYYGTGAKGREADRVFAADDKRLRERIYFYVDAGKGVTPEQGVGANGHTVNLNNLYDADKDGFVQLGVDPALRSNDEAWMNAFESAVIDAGFDGYLRDFGTQRAAVLIGRHSVPVTYVGTGKQTGAVNASEAQKPARRTDLPLGQMTGAEWKKLEPRATDLEDGKRYYRSDIKFSPAREYIAEIEGRLAKIKASDNQGGLSMVEANLANIKRGLAGEIVRDEQGNLLAPNGRKSKLTEQQYLQVRTPAFRKWFGDWLSFHNAKNGNGVWTDGDRAVSKIVDENGEPLVVYHGTEKGGFTVMRPDRGDKHRSPMLFAAATRQTARTYSWKGDEIDLAQPEFAGAVARKIGNDWFVVQKSGDPSEAYNVYGELVDVEQAEGYVSKKEAEYFRDNELEQYLRDRGEVQTGIYSMFLNIRDPIERDFEGANWDGNTNDMFEVLGEDGDNIYADDGRRLMPQDEAEALAEQNEGAEVSSVEWIGETTNTVAEEAKQYGQDGAIIRQVEDDGGRYPGGVLRPDDVFVFFDSNQAKSATQNTGAFSQKNDDLRYSPPRWYFSPLEKAFESAPDRVFTTAPQLKLWLAGNKAKLGLKDDEIFWTGINDFLDMQGNQKVSKADVLGYLAGNGVQVEEVMKGVQGYDENDPQLPVGSGMRVIEATDGVEGYEVLAKNGRVIGVGKTEADAISDAYSGNPEHWEGSEATKFGQYTLPGGTNYRELLLTLPNQSQYLKFKTELAKKYGFYGKMFAPIGSRATEAELAKLERLEADDVRLGRGAEKYKSSHWEEPNILAHIRMNDRTDAGGAKVLFIEEAQSDWGQEGKRRGFLDGNKARYEAEYRDYADELMAKYGVSPTSAGAIMSLRKAMSSDERAKLKELNDKIVAQSASVQSAPFVTDTKAWLALAVKRIMAYAAANGYDKVAFINGEQSADRYDLSKQVDRIGWFKNGNTGRKVMVDLGDVGTAELLTNQEGKIVGTRGARNAFIQAEGRMLDEAIGKEIAAKVMESPEGELSGEGLKVGGEGMKTFYDRIVPQVVSDQLKKVGGKMEAVEIGAIAKSEITEAYGRFYIEHGEDTEVYRTREEAEIAIGSSASLQQPGFTVTPKMSGPLPLFSTRRIVGDSGRQYDQTQRDFFKDVGRDIEQKNLVERTLDFLNKDFSKKMAVGLVDQFRGLRDLGDNGQAYMLARLSKGTAGAFDALLHHGKLSLKNGVYDADTSGGFVQRLGAPLNGELDDFLWYVAANRAEKLMPSDREHLFTPAHIAAGKSLANGTTNWDYTIQTGPQAGTVTRVRKEIFDDANRVFNEFQKNTLDMAEQSGLIDGTSRKYWESEFYVPFYRVSEEDNEFIGAKMGDALVRQQAFKKLKGGTDKLNSDLLSNTLLNFSHLIEASAKNRAAKASLGAAEQIGAAQRVAPDMASYAASNGTMLPPGTKKTVWFQENGQKVEYKVTDPFVMTAITSLEYAGMRNVFMDALSKFKHWLTIGVTASPAFKVRNLIRDSLQAIGTSNLSYNPIANVREGFRQTKRDSQEYVSALASGALIRFGTMLEGNESARTRQLIRSGVKDSTILNSEGKWQKFYDKVLEPCITAYNELGNRSEEINRAALYNQLIKQGKSHAEAALLARDLMDFSMQGAFPAIRFLTQVVPFMNARLQGMYKLRRAAKDNPRKMAVVTGAVAMASIALMLAYEDDDEWKRREPWDRDNYWWFKVGGEEFRIPKPFELGAIASMAERGLEYMINDEMTGERFLKETRNLVLNQLAMNPVPQAVKPIIDLYANKDSFTGRPIESMSMQRLDPTMRYNSNTSMTARAASNAVGGALSPVQVDHLVRGYFAWLGAFVNGGADMAWRAMSNEPTKPTMDYWKFATQGIVQETDSAGSRYVTQVYEQAKELERAHATWKRLIKDGKVEEATAYREDHADELRRYKQVEAVKKIESNLNDRIHRIEISAIDPDLKKEQINNIKRMKEAAAKRISPGAY